MSVFNLDRFRFDKNVTTSANKEQGSGSKSPESEKENKPEKLKSNKALSKNRGVVFEDVLSADSEEESLSQPKIKHAPKRRFVNPKQKTTIHTISDDEDDEMEDKVNRLLEMFPRLARTQVLKVIRRTSTLDGAVAVCLLEYGDKEGPNKKRKVDLCSNSQDGGEDPPKKKRKPSLVSEEEGDDDDNDDNEEKDPSWEKQEAMVRRLQRKFPDQDKEELRMVLQEHNWDDEVALQVLQMFSDPGKAATNTRQPPHQFEIYFALNW